MPNTMIMKKKDMSSRIIEIEMTIMKAMSKGHKPSTGDQFQPMRIEQEILRCMYFGEDSPHCRRMYTKKGDQ